VLGIAASYLLDQRVSGHIGLLSARRPPSTAIRPLGFAERLPIEGGTISCNGSEYVVLDIHPEEAGTVVILGPPEVSAEASA
jgi:hypothetical protein